MGWCLRITIKQGRGERLHSQNHCNWYFFEGVHFRGVFIYYISMSSQILEPPFPINKHVLQVHVFKSARVAKCICCKMHMLQSAHVAKCMWCKVHVLQVRVMQSAHNNLWNLSTSRKKFYQTESIQEICQIRKSFKKSLKYRNLSTTENVLYKPSNWIKSSVSSTEEVQPPTINRRKTLTPSTLPTMQGRALFTSIGEIGVGPEGQKVPMTKGLEKVRKAKM